MSAKPPRSLVLAAAGLFLISSTAASCDDEQTDVRLGAAARGTVAEIVEAPGSVTARAAATVSAPAAGTLDDLRVESGQRVGRGQVLAVIDAPDLEARRRSAERALEQAENSGGGSIGGTSGFTAVRKKTDKQAADAFQDAREAAGKITDPALREVLLKQVDAARQQYEAASEAAGSALRSVQRGVASLGEAVSSLSAAQRLQAQQAYELADAAVEALTLRAPVAGVVQLGGTSSASTPALSDLLAQGPLAAAGPTSTLPGVDEAVPRGGYVAAGTPILTVVDVSKLGLTAEVDETDVLLVKAGVKATVELDAATGASYPATVRAIDLLPTTSSRGGVSYKVRLDLAGGKDADGKPAPTPRPGMSAVVRLQVREADDAVTVPASAIINVDGKDTVWAVRGGSYQRVPVTLGVQGEDVVQVTNGLTAGERIAVAGADEIRPGDKAS
ncbi:RND transporter [Paractinoplanes abujensis]|uniref:Multidrug efflux pump subunit AcrA (Membrane-fusion protein) n=1 Tax=Paractinoplanes abujensis TaxID=882441 RepID=A0A7W7FY54_9ACTN|nr:efflux RND transporter periplasmic adaptor subunit [Actinoplanes abujensis]MBB4690638.1 multidrug efflux pump subunit AcrA (membrane-fusion protein) [Actinoplanes abujensis]GID17949.1 RND transporter [Actinoplanes abujensis]